MADFELPAGDMVESLLVNAQNAELAKLERWKKVYSALSELRGDENRSSNGHLDGKTDLILRMLEREQAKCFEKFGTHRDGGAFMMQMTLSKYWVLSSFELLRTCCDNQICENGMAKNVTCDRVDCFGCRVVKLKKMFAPVRMPLTKLEPQARRQVLEKIKEIPVLQADQQEIKYIPFVGSGKYHPFWLHDKETGCVGWSYYDAVSGNACITSRHELSDSFLSLID